MTLKSRMWRHVAPRRCGTNGKASFRLFRYNMRLDNNNRKDAMACNILKKSVECTAKELVAESRVGGNAIWLYVTCPDSALDDPAEMQRIAV